jgi:hypothetical protein
LVQISYIKISWWEAILAAVRADSEPARWGEVRETGHVSFSTAHGEGDLSYLPSDAEKCHYPSSPSTPSGVLFLVVLGFELRALS